MSLRSRVLDVSQYIANLGDPNHGLRAAKVIELQSEQDEDGDGTARLPDRIYQAASGPVTTSTCVMPVRRADLLVGDPNCYYRSLGFFLPTRAITKKQLRRAYSARHGSNSTWLTYCLKQLLNPEVRAAYDNRPPGYPMMDRYIAAALRNQAKKWASKKSRETGEEIDPDDYLKQEYGIELDAHGEVVVETDRKVSTDTVISHSGWPYGFYLWRSRKWDEETLSDWQRILVRVFADRDLSTQIAVGYCGDTAASHTERVHSGNLVLFLHEDAVPTRALAEAAVTDALRITSVSPLSPVSLLFDDESEIDMSTTTEEPEFDLSQARRGGQQAEDKAAAEKAARDAARQRTEYLTSILQKDGDTAYIRFLMDEPEWPEFHQHSYVPTCPPPEGIPDDMKSKWPTRWFAVCRKSERANGTPWYSDCYICDHMRKSDGKSYSRGLKLWALACVRKEVIGTAEMAAEGKIDAKQVGRRVGFVDEIVEFPEIKDGKETGRTLRRKRVVVLNFSMKNFFSQFITFANEKVFGTVLDRDYLITRKGDGTEVDYIATPMDVIQVPIKDPDTGAVTGTEPFDLRESKFAARYADHGINLGEIIKRSMSRENYDRYFDPRVTVKWKNDDDEDTSSGGKHSDNGATASAGSTPSEDKLREMRDRIMNESKPGAAATPAPVATSETEASAGTSALVDFA